MERADFSTLAVSHIDNLVTADNGRGRAIKAEHTVKGMRTHEMTADVP
jgi:hypothetical protein